MTINSKLFEKKNIATQKIEGGIESLLVAFQEGKIDMRRSVNFLTHINNLASKQNFDELNETISLVVDDAEQHGWSKAL